MDMRSVANLDPIEVASRDELEALQLKRLRWSLRHAYENVAYYRERFDAVGFHPDSLNTLSDLRHAPFITKQDMRDQYPFGLFATPMDKVARLHASSGTTGKPVVSGHTMADVGRWAHCAARGLHAVGARSGDIFHIALVYGLKTGAFPMHYAAEKLGIAVAPVAGDSAERHVQYLRDFKPRLFMSNRSQVLTILDQFDRMGIDARDTALEIGIFGGETGGKALRESVARRFGITAYEAYGLTEVCGAGMAFEVPGAGGSLTIWEDWFYPEIVDPKTDDVLPEGELGELVLTTLGKEANPIVRYRTRDVTRLLPPMNRSMRRLDFVKGRIDDMAQVGGKSIFPLAVEDVLIAQPQISPFYRIRIQFDDRGQERFLIEIEMSNDLAGASEEARQACRAAIAARVEAACALTPDVSLLAPQTLGRGPDKAKRIVDERGR